MTLKNCFFHSLIITTIIGANALGFWQLQRREWKRDMLAHIEQSYQGDGKPLPALKDIKPAELPYSHVAITVLCDVPDYVLQPGKFFYGKPGYYLYCNGTTPHGYRLLLLVGWVDKNFKLESLKDGGSFGYSMFAGLMPFHPAPWYLPKDNDKSHMIWPVRPPDPSYPVYAVLDKMKDGGPIPTAKPNARGFHGTIIPIGEKPNLPNNHLQYAITWFALAAAILAAYIYRMRGGQ